MSAVAGGMLAALGVMPQLGSTPSRGGGSAACKSKTGGSLSVHKSPVASAASSSSSCPVKKEGAGAEGGGKGAPVPRDPSKLCKCKKSKCVRQYCVCFRAGLLCEGCDCSECLNDGAHEVERLAAIQHIKTSDPLAFVDKIRPEVLFLSHTHTRTQTLARELSHARWHAVFSEPPLVCLDVRLCMCVLMHISKHTHVSLDPHKQAHSHMPARTCTKTHAKCMMAVGIKRQLVLQGSEREGRGQGWRG